MAKKKTATKPEPEAKPEAGVIQVELSHAPTPPTLSIDKLLTKMEPLREAGFQNREQYAFACGLLPTLRQTIKGIDAYHKRMLQPFTDAMARAKAIKAEDLMPWQQAETLTESLIRKWDDDRAREVREERERKQREEEERVARERQQQLETIKAAAKTATSKDARESLKEQAAALKEAPLPVPVVAVEEPKAADGTMNRRSNFKGRVDDPRALLVAAMTPVVIGARKAEIRDAIITKAKAEGMQTAGLGMVIDLVLTELAIPTGPDESIYILHQPSVNDAAREVGLDLRWPGVTVYDDPIYSSKPAGR